MLGGLATGCVAAPLSVSLRSSPSVMPLPPSVGAGASIYAILALSWRWLPFMRSVPVCWCCACRCQRRLLALASSQAELASKRSAPFCLALGVGVSGWRSRVGLSLLFVIINIGLSLAGWSVRLVCRFVYLSLSLAGLLVIGLSLLVIVIRSVWSLLLPSSLVSFVSRHRRRVIVSQYLH
jgi:hypothetical protein